MAPSCGRGWTRVCSANWRARRTAATSPPRARGGRAPAGVLANLATVRARRAQGDTVVERQLSHLSAREDAVGRIAGYNLGTMLGQRGEVDRALGELRRALERDPGDVDARWN